jgi:hypothetical protein
MDKFGPRLGSLGTKVYSVFYSLIGLTLCPMDKFGPRLGSLGTKVYLFVPTFIGAQIDLLPWFHCVCM